MRSIVSGIIGGVLSAIILINWMPNQTINVQIQADQLNQAFDNGYKKAMADAYNIVTPPMALEYACANLWLNQGPAK
jgi:ribonuclease PH